MLIKPPADLRYSDITPKALYLGRREFLQSAALAAGSLAGALPGNASAQTPGPGKLAKLTNVTKSRFSTSETLNDYEDITTYNNFFEFGTDKDEPAKNAKTLKPRPWSIAVEG